MSESARPAGGLRRELRFWEAIALSIALVAAAFLVFTIYKNVAGTAAPYNRFPWIVLAWLAVGAAIVAVAPGVVRRIGVALTRELAEPDHRAT
jgi:amino acid transporter